MDLRAIFIANGIGIVLLIMLIFVSRTKVQRRQIEDRLFSFMIIGVIIACIAEAFSYVLDGRLFPGARILNYLINTYLFTFNLILSFCIVVYVDFDLYKDPGRILKKYKLQIILGIVMLLVNIVNFFVPISYYITPENVYERRPLSYAYYFVIVYYALTAIFTTHQYEKKYRTRSFVSIEMFIVPMVIGTSLQFISYGLSLAWLSAAIGLVGLYMMQQNEMAYIDTLTGLFNRQYLNHIIDRWKAKDFRFSGMMIDIDRFKQINDSFGHSEGDRALVILSDKLRAASGSDSLVFRFAGDEFIILSRTEAVGAMKDKLSALQKTLDSYAALSGLPYRIDISYGSASFEPSLGDVDSFMKEMDERMYEMKRLHHCDGV